MLMNKFSEPESEKAELESDINKRAKRGTLFLCNKSHLEVYLRKTHPHTYSRFRDTLTPLKENTYKKINLLIRAVS